MNKPQTTAERTARALRLNQELRLQQVPAGDVEALAEYKRKNPWAVVSPPEIVEPARTSEQIEEDNRVRQMLAEQQGRIAHGDSLTDAPSE